MSSPLDRLTAAQRHVLDARCTRYAAVADLSWNLVDTVVLHLRTADGDRIVKAARGDALHHLRREADAFAGWVDVLARTGHAAHAEHIDLVAGVLIVGLLPGALVDGTDAALAADVHHQAGGLLRRLHDSAQRADGGASESAITRKALWWLEQPHALGRRTVAVLRDYLAAAPVVDLPLVPTHGDYQPRNWVIDDHGVVRVIDWGRFAFRPALSDFSRMSSNEWQASPDAERAFIAGYGVDPRHGGHWLLTRVRDAVATACWSRRVGDAAFEAHGYAMIERVLPELR